MSVVIKKQVLNAVDVFSIRTVTKTTQTVNKTDNELPLW